MTADEPSSIYVRIIELPPVRMARSGSGDLEAFDRWWSTDFNQRNNQLCPRDFMWYNPQLGSLEWLYALPEGLNDTAGYEVFDFPGGLYAVAACKDEDAEIEKTSKLIHTWVEKSGIFEEAPESSGRYEMGHVITPRNAREIMGYHQMDLFVPIVLKQQ